MLIFRLVRRFANSQKEQRNLIAERKGIVFLSASFCAIPYRNVKHQRQILNYFWLVWIYIPGKRTTRRRRISFDNEVYIYYVGFYMRLYPCVSFTRAKKIKDKEINKDVYDDIKIIIFLCDQIEMKMTKGKFIICTNIHKHTLSSYINE